MNIASVISGTVTAMKAMTWTSPDGHGTSKLNDVFDFENWGYTDGSPFACVNDDPGNGKSIDNKHFEFNTVLTISICSNWSIIEAQNDEDKRAEARLRLREAWDALKSQLFAISLWDGLGVDWAFDVSFKNFEMPEFNIYRRDIMITLKESIAR